MWSLLAAVALSQSAKPKPSTTPYLHAPAVNEYARHAPDGVTILPTGRYLRPAGTHTPVARWPHGMTLSRDGSVLFIASGGVGQLVTDWQSSSPKIATLPQSGTGRRKGNAGGAAFSPDGSKLYWSSGESGEVNVYDVAEKKELTTIALNVELAGKSWKDSYANDLAISEDGKTLYCADVTNFRLVTVDTESGKAVGAVKVGRYPYTLSVTGNKVYLANIGLFEYSAIPKPASGSGFDMRGVTKPPFAFPSKEARDGVEMEGRKIKGLGEPNVPESFSVWGVDVSDPASPRVISKTKTGLLIGSPSTGGKTIGGSAPNFVLAKGNSVYVSNGNNDIIERIDTTTGKITAAQRIVPSPLVAKLRGVGPSGMALSPNGKRLYVAESGINAIAVLDGASLKVLGHIPTCWYPYRLAISPDGGKIAVINFRGFGSGPNGGANRPKDPFVGMQGVLSTFDPPSNDQLRTMTATVLENNGIVDGSKDRVKMASPVVPTTPGVASKEIKYVVFITKENHAFDAVFDKVPGSNNDPSLIRWGYHQKIAAEGQPTLDDAPVMVNHNEIARQFAVSDNFYMEPEASGVGHRWLVGVQPNNLMQMTYTLGWQFKSFSSAPGRLYSMGSNGSLLPEDYPEAGSMWEHMARSKVSFRNYGEGFEFPGVGEDDNEAPSGALEVMNAPMSKVLYDNTSFDFPIFNMNIPDQYRADQFIKEYKKLYLSGSKPAPKFVNIAICNDHGTGPNAKKGYPYVASWMADNDLALGRIVEFLTHTPQWKNMAIFVTQDDSGGEPDHIDTQRSILLAISPWIKHKYVSHRLTTIVSMHRTLYELFGLPALNLFDGLANDFSDCFTTKPDFTPYTVRQVDKRIFDAKKVLDPNDPDYQKARKMKSVRRDSDEVEEVVLTAGQPH